jgi:hypothetical protein
VNEGSEAFIAKYPSDIKDQLAFNVEAADQRWSLEALKRDVEQLRIDA